MTEREMQRWSILRKRICDLASAGAPDFCPCGNFPHGPDEDERLELASKIFRAALEVAEAANAVREVIDNDDAPPFLGGDKC